MTCETCVLERQRDQNELPLWNNIYSFQHWHLVHAYNSALLGWLILASRKHITTVAEMSAAQAAELGTAILRTSHAMRECIPGIERIYVCQFSEAEGHGHVHFHVVPRLANEKKIAVQIFDYLGVDETRRVNEADMQHLAKRILQTLRKVRIE